MNPIPSELKNDLKKSLELVSQLKDEIRVKMHLAGMDAKDQWNRLEPRIRDVEAEIGRAAGDVSDASREALRDLITKMRTLRDRLH